MVSYTLYPGTEKRGSLSGTYRVTKQSQATSRQPGKDRQRQAGRQASRQAGRQVGRQADRQVGRQVGRQADRQAGSQAEAGSRQATRDFWDALYMGRVTS